ncbi:hypothetical protein IMCC3317_04860 [Kordia antarctica]|uniref:FG-GAP repeat protein n=1 Tax=Kordia antarctica TaxID=1218801 RepID=A0A7L4ZF61_9FLAO|nr:hypothetical protein [Kordia antarctica]QHI35140.1 hypothetical protein IMCC3317_04860 [Kordia antarctica]
MNYKDLSFQRYLAVSLVVFFLTNNLRAQGFFEQIAVKNNSVNYFPSQLGDNGWVLRSQDHISQVGKFNFDNRSELIIQGGSGLGIIALDANNEFATVVQTANSSTIPASSRLGWTVSATDKILGVGYFYPNYKHDILVQNNSGLGIISLDNNSNFLTTSNISSNRTFEGGWRYNRNDKILGIGDFNNDNRSDFIIKSYTHIGIKSVDDQGLFKVITSGVDNSYLGNSFWRLKYSDQILGVGDFDGNKRSDFIIKSNTNLSILSLDEDENFTRVAIGSRGEYLGDSYWRYKATDEILGVGNFDGDNRSDFIIKSATNISVISVNDSGDFTRVAIGAVGEYLGDSFWRYKTTDEILEIGDFDGDNRSDFIIQSDTHIAIIGVNDAGNFFSSVILTKNTAFSSSGISFPASNHYKGVGNFNVDDRSDFIIKDNYHLRIFNFKEDINRYFNVDDCDDCTRIQNEEISIVMNEMLGINGGDSTGNYISNAAAKKPVLWGRNWYPVRGTREILCGTFESYGVTKGVFDNVRGASEYDWNININPNPSFERLIDEVRPYRDGSDEWKLCRGEPCMEAEVTPPTALNDFHYFMTERDSTLFQQNQQICVYGPWVREEVHGNRPEIHPSELLWWENANGSKVMVMVKDASDRFDEAKNFADKPPRFKPWAAGPMIKQFKIAFSIELGTETEQFTLDVGRKHYANTYKNASIYKDILAGRRYGLEKNGEIPILVIESLKADKYLGVTFDSVCYNASTNRLQGYILVKAQIGTRAATFMNDAELGAFLEIKLNSETITIRR